MGRGNQVRDSQKARVYAAERCMEVTHAELGYRHGKGWSNPLMTLTECQQLVDTVLADKLVQQEFRSARTRINVEAGRGGWGSIQRIQLGTWARQPHVVLHEVAHHLAGLHAAHGPEFVSVCLWLTQRFMGAEMGEQLRRSYAEHNVKYGNREPAKPVRKSQLVKRDWKRSVQPTAPVVRTPELASAARAQAPKPSVSSDTACTDCGTTERKVGSGGKHKTPLCNRCYRKR